jgi:hypothetical protein
MTAYGLEGQSYTSGRGREFFFPHNNNDGRSRDSSVGVQTGYELDGRHSNPDRGKIFLFSITSGPDLGPTQPIQWEPGVISQVVKRPRREADH